ncbi:L-Arabinitol 4-dehydrogenase [Aspergillus phoenicis ATCC 13157]|uniref:D-xylulose reductase n=1 Tax=Aspergillus phoenicis ATCC 13157 TaxID=1353007 RepID=A0A370PFT3_ASPPH|nr:L-Arabinitol 4-dehydrogenase [Aspergillus phoenicis ATCC 13157]GLA26498.1 N-terminal acetyltransferase A complex catalytic subunit ard1 [Aspergillus niger]
MSTNRGVFTDTAHGLYIADAAPAAETVPSGSTLQPGEVTVAIKSSGICGSDVHFWKHGGIGPWQVTTPHILGHESAGEVVAVHPSVTSHAVGDRVAIEPHIVCFACEPCLTGRYNGCKNLIFRSSPPAHGLLRTYVNHPAVWCHKIGPQLSFDEGALLEPLSVALTGVTKAGVTIGDPVVVCGAGPIGLIVSQVCRATGAWPIIITDINEARLIFAEEYIPGVRTCLMRRDESPEECAARVNGLMGDEVEVAVALECTGTAPSLATAVHTVKFGGKVFVIGVGQDKLEIPFMRMSAREIDLQFQQRYVNMWPRAIRVLESGMIDLKKLVTHEFVLENAVEAFQTAADPTCGAIKVLIRS